MGNITKNYEPKVKFILKDNINLDINSTFIDMIIGLGIKNAVDVLKMIKIKYGITYKHMAGIMRISNSAIKQAINFGTFEGVVKEEKLIDGILNLQEFYLQDSFAEIEIEEVK